MGTGKTLSALWAFHYLLNTDVLDWCVVVSPLSTLERAWTDEIFENFSDLNYTILHGTHMHKLVQENRHVYVINHDGLKNKEMLKALMLKPGRGLVIIDELGTYRNGGTARWKALNFLVNGAAKLKIPPKEWVWGLTGTPTPNAPSDAWAECRLITPHTVPKYFRAFKDMVMRQISPFKWIGKDDAADTVHRVMQPSIRYARKDCIDLPPTMFVDREVALSPEQEKMYKAMQSKMKAEYDGVPITAVNEAVMTGKLIQICCGTAYGKDSTVIIPSPGRIAETVSIIEESESKTIVFVPITAALKNVAKELEKHFPGKVAMVYGDTSLAERNRIFAAFQRPGGYQVIVANPFTMSHGLTLTAASTIVWFTACPSNDIYQQANARIVRPGQLFNTLIVNLYGSNVERRTYRRVSGRQDDQLTLLDLFE